MSTITKARMASPRQVSESIDPSETLYRLTVDEYERLGDVLRDQRVTIHDRETSR